MIFVELPRYICGSETSPPVYLNPDEVESVSGSTAITAVTMKSGNTHSVALSAEDTLSLLLARNAYKPKESQK